MDTNKNPFAFLNSTSGSIEPNKTTGGSEFDFLQAREKPLSLGSVNAADIGALAKEEGAAHLMPVINAIYGQESSAGANSKTSTDGARGGMQIMPDTFRRFAKQGESIDNPADNMRVGLRIIKSLGDKFGNDPGKIATGYFSGEGNVNAGNGAAWKNDHKDGNGKSVSGYVSDVLGRLSPVKEAKAAENLPDLNQIPKWSEISTSERFLSLPDEEKTKLKGAYFDDVLAPHAGAEAAKAREQFMAQRDTAPGFNEKLDTKLAGIVPAVQGLFGLDKKPGTGSVMAGYNPAATQSGAANLQDTMATSKTLRDVDASVENRRARLVGQGEAPEFADRAAREAAAAGVTPGAEIAFMQKRHGTVGKSDFDFETSDQFKKQTGLNNPLVRGAAKAGLGTTKALSGYTQFMGDVLGIDGMQAAGKDTGAWARGKEEAIGEKGNYLERNLEGAINSIGQQLPLMIAGVSLETQALPLAGMAMQTFGQEYSDGRSVGQTPAQATQRAAVFAAFEVIGEKFGLGDSLKAIKAAARGMPNDQIVGFLWSALKKEVPGELLTTTGQFGTDKLPGIGLNQAATGEDYLKQVGDTIAQTIMQSGVMAGGTTGVSTAVRYLRDKSDNANVDAIHAEDVRQKSLDRWNAGLLGVPREAVQSVQTPDGRIEPNTAPATPQQTTAAEPAPIDVHPTSAVADSIVADLATQNGIPYEFVLPQQKNKLPGTPESNDVNDQDVLDYAEMRHRQLLAKLHGRIEQVPTDSGLVDQEVPGQALTPEEQAELNTLETQNPSEIRSFYGMNQPIPSDQSANQSFAQTPAPAVAPVEQPAQGSVFPTATEPGLVAAQENQHAQNIPQATPNGSTPSQAAIEPTGQPVRPAQEQQPTGQGAAAQANPVNPVGIANQQVQPDDSVTSEFDVSGRNDQQLSVLATKGQPGWKEAALAELAKRGISQEPAAPKGQFKTADEAQAYIQAQRRRAGSKLPKALPLPHEDGSFGVVTDGQSGWEQAVAYAKANAPKTEKESRERRSSNVKKSYDVWDEDGNKGTINIVRSKDGSLFRIFQIWTNQDGETAQFEQSTGYGEGITDDYIVKAIAEPGDLLLTNPNDKPKTEKEAKARRQNDPKPLSVEPQPAATPTKQATPAFTRKEIPAMTNEELVEAHTYYKNLGHKRAAKIEKELNKRAQSIKEQTNGDQAAETVETQAQEPQASDAGTGQTLAEKSAAARAAGYQAASEGKGKKHTPKTYSAEEQAAFKAGVEDFYREDAPQTGPKPVTARKAGDILFDKYGDDYRIEGERIGEVTLTKNRDKLSERKVRMSSQDFERLMREDKEYRSGQNDELDAEMRSYEAKAKTETKPVNVIEAGVSLTGSDLTAVDAAKYLKDFVYSLDQLNGMTDKAQAILSSELGKSGRDTLLMEAYGLTRDQAHDINNSLDARKPYKIRRDDMQEAFRVFPGLRKIIDSAIAEAKGKNDSLDSHIETAQKNLDDLRKLQADAVANGNAWVYDKKIADAEKTLNSYIQARDKKSAPETTPVDDAIQQQFANNKVFTADKVEAARARLRSKLTQMNSGIDPEVIMDGMTIAGAYIESGVRKFSDYAKAMTADFGDKIKPFLLSFYEAARNYPGIDNEGMSTVDEAKAEHDALVKGMSAPAKEEVKEVIGTTASKPAKRTKKTGSKTDMTLTQDWGTEHIDGYGTEYNRETGNDTKDAFLKETKNYLNAVAGILTEQGYLPQKDSRGRDMKPVSVNESGMASSGEVSLTMYHPDGHGVYAHIGDTSLRGVVPTTKSGIAIMFRAASQQDKYGAKSTNRWAPVDLSAADLASMLDKEAKSSTPKVESPKSATILKDTEADNADTTTTAGGASNRALEGTPAAEVRGTQAGRNTEQRGAESGRNDAGTAGDADRAGDTGGSRVGDGARNVSVPARGRGGKRGSADQRRVQTELGIEQTDSGTVSEQRDAEISAARQEQKAAVDYRITDLTRLGEGGQKTKYRNNVAAIRLLNDLQQTGRSATPAEQDVLARYVGWGGIAQAFDPDNKEWSTEYAELKAVLTEEEWETAKESTQYAHYTSQEIIEGMWDAARHMGFTGGNILEPGSGVGNFIGLMPEDLRSASRFTAVERERIAGGIAKQLYPNQNVQQQDFRKFNAQDGYYDLVAGNPPFSSTTLTDLSGRKHLSGLSIHNYFFAKSVDMLGEGKILMQVVSNSFLDAKGDKARRYIGERTEFLGAIRLPNKAFAKNANTEVTTDIVFLKKRPESEWGSKAAKDDMQRWQGIGSVADPLGGDPIPLNQYFIDHPEMMLGRMERAGSMYGPGQPALIARDGQDTRALMKEAIARLPKDVFVATTKITNEAMQEAAYVALSKEANVDIGGHYVVDGKVFVRMNDVAGEGQALQLTGETKISEKRVLGSNGLDRIRQLANMRVTVRGLIAAEINDAGNIEELRAKLNEQYDAYAQKYGYINARGTVQLFGDDPDFPLLASLENNYDPGIGAAAAKNQGIKPVPASAKKATIFSQRVIEKHEEITSADTPEDALMVSIAERGQIDAGYIGKLLGKDGKEVLDGLTKGENPALFVDPATSGYVLADEYLSGNVRKKLAQAKAAGMYGNVAALEKVIPEDIPSHEISGKIGAPWISTEVYQEFAAEIMGEGTKARVVYVPAMSSYVASFQAGSDVANKNTFGTSRMGADEIYAALLNSKEIRVGHYEEDPSTGSRRFVLEKDATDEANDKAREIKDKFNDWLFADADRAEKMQRAYNDAVNNYVTREFDGSMLKFPGKVPDAIIKLRRHQRNAVARIIQDGRALLDHVVGAGKTFTVIAAAMELKRTGLAKKPMIVVPNHLVKQWAADFYRLYPGANILTATKKDFEKQNRRKFLAKIATGNWDAVIIAHSSFGFIKPDAAFEARFNEERINEIVEAIKALKEENDQTSKRTVKQLAKMKENLENKLASLRDRPMDDLLDFGQLGNDQLFVDEAHLFKNLMFVTKMQNVRGLGQPKGSQRAYDMFIKTHQIYEKNGNGRGVVFATGTPVSNSLAEMYHMLRYLAPETLKDSGQFTFDAWAKTFADVEQVWMQSMSGDGYKSSNRMSRFVNTPELLRVYDQVADTVTIDDIKQAFAEENNGAEFPIPKQKNGRRTPVSIPRSQAQTEYMEEIAKRAKALEQRRGKPQKGDDNMLSIMGDARKAAMDIRMVRFDIEERDPNGRIAIAANNIFERYQKYNDVRGTQLVFSDMGTPKKHAEKELKEYNELTAEAAPLSDEQVLAMAELGNEEAQNQIEKAEEAQRKIEAKGQDWLDAIQAAMRGFSIYDDLKNALMEKGIPEKEIAFIHDYNTDDQKAALFRAVNDGKVRVLLGSTEKMGAGTNVQERAVALHHLDVPWKPSDIEQREGRVIRQGNRLLNEVPDFEVEVMAYATQDTLDLFMWQTQEKKLSMIGQLRTGNVGREVDNAFEEMQMSAGEMQAAATSNPYLLEEIQLKEKVKKLERQKRSFEGQKNDLINRVRRAEKDVESLPPQIKEAQTIETAAQKVVEDKAAHFDNLTATVNGAKITGSDAIRQALRDAIEASPMVTKDGKETRSVNIEFNGKEYTSESGVAEAVNKALGDAAKITYTLPDGTTVYRGADVVAGLIDPVADLLESDKDANLGKVGGFDVMAYGAGEGRFDVMVTLNGLDVGDYQIRTDSKEPGVLSARLRSIPTEVNRIIQASIGLPAFLKSKLEKAKRTLADIEGMQDEGEWSGEAELKKAREDYRAILKKLAATAETKSDETGGTPETNLSRGRGGKGIAIRDLNAVVARARSSLKNLPTVHALKSPEGLDLANPSQRRLYDHIQEAGAANDVEGATHDGEIYLFSANIADEFRAEHVLVNHEVGHYGLREVFGRSGLDPILNTVYMTNAKVRKQADVLRKKFGLESNAEATEEVLVEMAPKELIKLNAWRRLVRNIRDWLNDHGFGQMASRLNGLLKAGMTEQQKADMLAADVVNAARDWVRNGTPSQSSTVQETKLSQADQNDSDLLERDRANIETAARRMGQFVDEFLDGKVKDSDTYILGDTPAVLRALGAEDRKMQIDGYTIHKILDGKHRYFITPDMLKQIPDHLYDPLAVFDSPKDGKPGKIVLTELSDAITGKPVIVAVHLSKKSGRITVNEISSVYETSDGTQRSKLTPEALEYYRNEKSLEQTTTPNLSTPLAGVVQSAQDLGKNILTESDIVKQYGPKFSRKPIGEVVRDLQSNVVQFYGNQDLKTFNGLNRTINTQFHKALKDKDFGRVYNLIQGMQNHVATASARPAELAPGILHRVDNVIQAVKTLVSKSQRQAIEKAGDALFAGTLNGHSVMDGRVWTEAELREKFKLDDTGVALYRQARKAIDASLTELAAAEAYALAENYLPKALRADIIESPEDAGALIVAALGRQIDMARKANLDEDAQAGIADAKEKAQAIFDQADKLKKAGYAPLMRFGKFDLKVMAIDPETGNVERDENDSPVTLYYSRFESQSKLREMERQLQARYADKLNEIRITPGVVNESANELYRGVNPETMSIFAEAIGARQAADEYIRLVRSERSAMKRRLERKGTAGYSVDLQRVLANFITSNARQSAQQLYGTAINRAIRQVPREKGDVQKEALALRDYVINPDDNGAFGSSLMFAWFLGGSPAAALVNMTQPVMMTLPYLSQYGATRAAAELTKAVPYAMGAKEISDRELRQAMKKASLEGIVDAQEVFHLYAIGTRQLSAGPKRQAAMTLWGSMFAAVEGMNRRLTFIAAWNMAKAKGMANPYDFAVNAVNQTQGIYNKANRPNAARSTVGRAVFTFKTYSIMYVELMHRMWKSGPQGKKAVLLMMAVLILASGVEGLPGAKALDDLIDTIGQWMGYDTNMKRWKRRHAYELLGKVAGDLVLYGASSLTPFDFGGRLGLGNIIPGTDMLKPSSGLGNYGRAFGELIGPTAGAAQQVGDAAEAMEEGNYGQAAINLMPKAVRDFAKAIDMGRRGYARDMAGRKTVEVTPAEAVIKGVGFNPTVIADKSRASMPLQQDIQLAKKREASIVQSWAQAAVDNDPQEVKAQAKRLADWNRDNPDTPIRITPDQIHNKVKLLTTDKSSRITKTAPKEMRGRIGLELMK